MYVSVISILSTEVIYLPIIVVGGGSLYIYICIFYVFQMSSEIKRIQKEKI